MVARAIPCIPYGIVFSPRVRKSRTATRHSVWAQHTPNTPRSTLPAASALSGEFCPLPASRHDELLGAYNQSGESPTSWLRILGVERAGSMGNKGRGQC